jgi:hypothetical protein
MSEAMRVIRMWDGRISVFAAPYQAFVTVSGDTVSASATNSPDPNGYFYSSTYVAPNFEIYQVADDKFFGFYANQYTMFRIVGDVVKMYWTGTWSNPATWLSMSNWANSLYVNTSFPILMGSWSQEQCFLVGGLNNGASSTLQAYGFGATSPNKCYGPSNYDYLYQNAYSTYPYMRRIHTLSLGLAVIENSASYSGTSEYTLKILRAL